MDSEASSVHHGSAVLHRLSPAIVPALLISINYVDPGKWAAAVDVGSRFGLDLVAWVFVFSFAAVLCQYLSARIGVVTGRDLAQICHDEYDKNLSVLLGIQIEFAKIALDMTRVMGIAHGLNLLFGVDVFTCVLLTGVDAVFYPLVASFMENSKTKLYCILMAGFVLCAYVFGVLLSQPEVSESVGGGGYNDSGESTFALMTLLGASILPQNFYLHSALVRQNQIQNRGTPSTTSKDALSQEHFFATFCIYSCTSLATYVLMNSAAYTFTSHDALTLVEQVFRIPAASFFFLLVLFGSTQVTAISWGLTGEVILQDIFRLDIPSWLHRVTIRIIAIVPAVYCVRTTGAEGIYQLFTFVQVIIAMLLPSAVIPLFRVASSTSLMGVHKMSQIMGYFALAVFSGMLCLNVMFLVELMFGTSDGAENVWWDIDGTSSFGYVLLLVIGWLSLGLTLCLLATPLKSASAQLDAQASTLNLQTSVPECYTGQERLDSEKDRFFVDSEKDRFLVDSEKDRFLVDSEKDRFFIDDERIEERNSAVESYPLRHGFVSNDVGPEPEPNPEPEPERHLTTIEEDLNSAEELPKSVQVSSMPSEMTKIPLVCTKPEATETVEKTVEVKREGGDVYSWEPEKSPNSSSSPIMSSDGPGSYRSLKGDDCGSGAGSLSRLAGLGRAARRQLAAILDEFWGQLFDFHGQMTQEARARKLDLLLGMEPKSTTPASRPETTKPGDYNFQSSMNSSLLDSSDQSRRMFGNQAPPSSLWGNQARLLDEYIHRTGPTETGERRYSSLRVPPSSEGLYNQPATIHGYQLATYLKQMQRNPDQFSRQGEIPVQKSLIMGPPGYTDARPYLGQRLQNGLSPRYQSVNTTNSDVALNGPPSPGPTNAGQQPVNTKKYHSLPDISGISVLQRGLHGSPNRTPYEPSMLSNSAVRGEPHLAFDDLSPSGRYQDALSRQLASRQMTSSSSDTASLWSRQPFEQFGVAEKIQAVGGVIGDKLDPTAVDMEAVLLKSLRQCILKLLKLEGSDWLFKQNDGADEELIDRVAAREKLVQEVENRVVGGSANLMVSSLPHCGDGCIWRADLVVSFGVWCIHRVLDLSLMESRPELWGKYTYVLNRLQGVIEPAFSKPRVPSSPCFCLQLPGSNSQPFGSPISGSNGMLPPTSKPGRGKCTNSAMLLDIIKDVEIAISSRKGRTGTAAGDVAFPKGKENLASVLKRYKRRLSSNRPASGDGPGSRKGQMSSRYCS